MLDAREHQCLQLCKASWRTGLGHFLPCMLEYCCWMSFYKVQKRDKQEDWWLSEEMFKSPRRLKEVTSVGKVLLYWRIFSLSIMFPKESGGGMITVVWSGWIDVNHCMELMSQCKTCNVIYNRWDKSMRTITSASCSWSVRESIGRGQSSRCSRVLLKKSSVSNHQAL